MNAGFVIYGGQYQVGDRVEVRSRAEILSTLDDRGMLDALPFMPEMLRYCGRQFTVRKTAHKICDTVHYSGIRKMKSAVFLEDLRCDGSAHGGCDAACLLIWKEAWLKPIGPEVRNRPRDAATALDKACTLQKLEASICTAGSPPDATRYVCQITEMLNSTQPWAWWNPNQYLADIVLGNYTAQHVVRTLMLGALRRLLATVPTYGFLKLVYNWIASTAGSPCYFTRNDIKGRIPKGFPTPGGGEELIVGDWVRIRTRDEIVGTIDTAGKNKGLFFDAEMVPYCGGTYRVRGVVRKIVDEASGRMLNMKSPCIFLDGVSCKSEYSEKRLMCPRSIPAFWRPIWLEKTAAPQGRLLGIDSR